MYKKQSGVNFINVFMCSFYTSRSQKHKKLLDLTVSFAPLGSAHVKGALKMLMKLSPEEIFRLKNNEVQISRRIGGSTPASQAALKTNVFDFQNNIRR